MARNRYGNQGLGIGAIVVAMGMIFFLLFLLLIPTLPFEITVAEQAVMYLMSFLIVMAGVALLLKGIMKG